MKTYKERYLLLVNRLYDLGMLANKIIIAICL
jgi:hypothetical protein